MARVEIQLNNGYLDISKEFPISLNYTIDDIRKPESRNSSFSKSILLPGTKNNNYLLGNLFDINEDFTFFNPNIRTNAKILVDSIPVLEGFLQLKNIKKLNNSDLQGNSIQYQVVIFDNSLNFFQEMGDKELTDLDFSKYTHTYGYSGITQSWTHTYDDIYTYPMMWKNSDTYETSDFKPAIFHRAYLERIALENGFSLGGPFMDNEYYKNEIIPYNGDRPKLSESEIERRKFRAGLTQSRVLGTFSHASETIFHESFRILGGYGDQLNDNSKSYILDDDSNGNNFDNGGVYDNILGKWTVDKNGKYNLHYKGQFNIEHTYPDLPSGQLAKSISVYPWQSMPDLDANYNACLYNPSSVSLTIEVRAYKNGSLIGVSVVGSYNLNTIINGPTQYYTANLSGQILTNQTLSIGDEITLRWGITNKNFLSKYGYASYNYCSWNKYGTSYYLNENIKVTEVFSSTTPALWNEPLTGYLTDGDIIDLVDFVPKKLKQKDIFIDLIKRYNLYIDIDPDNDKKLLLYTREDFYNLGKEKILDWTQKKDYSSEDKIILISEVQNKEMLFSYKEDKDTWNETYTSQTNEIYGQKEIEFTNEFVKGERKVQTPFSPTPLVYSSPNLARILPAIDAIEPKNNARVLYYGGMIDGLTSQTWTFNYVGGSEVYSKYPYAGHFDNPTSPTIDINYGEVPVLFYNDLTSLTNQTLYTRYWESYINQLDDGRIIESKFHLTPVDISYLKENMNALIFVKDSYFFINKIKDYNPLENGLTSVELIKVIEGIGTNVRPTKEIIGPIKEPPSTATEILVATPVKGGPKDSGGGPSTGGITTDYTSKQTSYSNSSKSMISGDNNSVGDNSKSVMIIGDNNIIGQRVEDSGIVGGDNNIIESGSSNSWIIGSSNKTISTSNELWIGETHFINGVNVTDLFKYNLIDGQLNRNLNNFSNYNFKIVDGGYNELRSITWTNPENLIDGDPNTGYLPVQDVVFTSVNCNFIGGSSGLWNLDFGFKINGVLPSSTDVVTLTFYDNASNNKLSRVDFLYGSDVSSDVPVYDEGGDWATNFQPFFVAGSFLVDSGTIGFTKLDWATFNHYIGQVLWDDSIDIRIEVKLNGKSPSEDIITTNINEFDQSVIADIGHVNLNGFSHILTGSYTSDNSKMIIDPTNLLGDIVGTTSNYSPGVDGDTNGNIYLISGSSLQKITIDAVNKSYNTTTIASVNSHQYRQIMVDETRLTNGEPLIWYSTYQGAPDYFGYFYYDGVNWVNVSLSSVLTTLNPFQWGFIDKFNVSGMGIGTVFFNSAGTSGGRILSLSNTSGDYTSAANWQENIHISSLSASSGYNIGVCVSGVQNGQPKFMVTKYNSNIITEWVYDGAIWSFTTVIGGVAGTQDGIGTQARVINPHLVYQLDSNTVQSYSLLSGINVFRIDINTKEVTYDIIKTAQGTSNNGYKY